MKKWYSEESYVKKFLNTMVEILFQKIPFPRQAEGRNIDYDRQAGEFYYRTLSLNGFEIRRKSLCQFLILLMIKRKK